MNVPIQTRRVAKLSLRLLALSVSVQLASGVMPALADDNLLHNRSLPLSESAVVDSLALPVPAAAAKVSTDTAGGAKPDAAAATTKSGTADTAAPAGAQPAPATPAPEQPLQKGDAGQNKDANVQLAENAKTEGAAQSTPNLGDLAGSAATAVVTGNTDHVPAVGDSPKLAAGPAVAAPAGGAMITSGPFQAAPLTQSPLVIDCDEVEEQAATIAYEELPTDEGKTHVKAGARFPIVISSEVTSKNAKKGDAISGHLKYELKIGERHIANKGSTVRGHLNYVLPARSVLHSLVSKERWYRNSGTLGITFDEVINEKGEHIPLVAEPARQALIVKNKGEGRVLGVNHAGQITGPWSQQLRYKAVRVGLNFAMAPAGVFSFGAMPVALGLIGAANPSFAFMKPVGTNVRHRRLKGFAWGFLSGVPGSWLIEDTVVKGQEAVIHPGDEFLAELRQDFTGEVATDAQLMPSATTKVRGEIVKKKKK